MRRNILKTGLEITKGFSQNLGENLRSLLEGRKRSFNFFGLRLSIRNSCNSLYIGVWRGWGAIVKDFLQTYIG